MAQHHSHIIHANKIILGVFVFVTTKVGVIVCVGGLYLTMRPIQHRYRPLPFTLIIPCSNSLSLSVGHEIELLNTVIHTVSDVVDIAEDSSRV